MGGSRKIARLAFMWGLIAAGSAATAVSQQAETVKPRQASAFSIPQSFRSTSTQILTLQQPTSPTAPQARRGGPWLPQPWQSVQTTRVEASGLGDKHTIVISTLGLVIAGVVLLILIL